MKLKITAALSLLACIGLTAFIAPVSKPDFYTVDTQKSTITWYGKKFGGSHRGTVALTSGTLQFNGKKLIDGGFIADMPTLKDNDGNGGLERHLKSADFFGVDKFPAANFVVKKVSGSGNAFNITGDLTIKGITSSVSFPATVVWNADGTVSATAEKIVIDRTKYDIKYKSKSIFTDIGDNFIYDEFEIGVKILAKKGTAAK